MMLLIKIHLKIFVIGSNKLKNAQTSVCKVLVANKCDKPDRVVTRGGKNGGWFQYELIWNSAKTNQNVNEVFNFLTQEILKQNEGKTQSPSGDRLKDNVNKEKKGCFK